LNQCFPPRCSKDFCNTIRGEPDSTRTWSQRRLMTDGVEKGLVIFGEQ
jgi:hypothetical protein